MYCCATASHRIVVPSVGGTVEADSSTPSGGGLALNFKNDTVRVRLLTGTLSQSVTRILTGIVLLYLNTLTGWPFRGPHSPGLVELVTSACA